MEAEGGKERRRKEERGRSAVRGIATDGSGIEPEFR